ncbi:gas vesicle protein GvpG [Streptomyces avermitilis]|uniref:gas vesicle protein GvpG n=1 Tax=Streptomyces avermitilis TaxID=33903 RepID=UPI0033A7CFC3
MGPRRRHVPHEPDRRPRAQHPAAARRRPRLEQLLEAGEIDETEFDRREDELLDRLETSSRSGAGTGNGTT